jgi:hypothetical protein
MPRIVMVGPRAAAFRIDIAGTHRERMRGLRGSATAQGHTLLLERCRSVHTVGMRFPITVAFLDADLRVIRVVRAPGGRVLFCRRARHVLECHIGADIRVGDVLTRRGARDARTTR